MVFLMGTASQLHGHFLKYCITQNFGGENFGETNVIRQYFTQPNSRLTKVANVSYCKFVNIFLTKTLKRSIRQSFTPPKFCAIQQINIHTYEITSNSSESKPPMCMYVDHVTSINTDPQPAVQIFLLLASRWGKMYQCPCISSGCLINVQGAYYD